MLKIKEEKMQELKNKKFEYHFYDRETPTWERDGLIIREENREIINFNDDLLYDLIKEDFVEKVSD